MRSVVFFIVFYVVIPTISAFLSVKGHVAALPDPEEAAVGMDMLFVMIPFYLYGAGSVHFSYTNRIFLRARVLPDATRRFLTWDVPCQIWVSGSLVIETWVFGRYDSCCVLVFITMTALFPPIVGVVAGLSYLLMPKEAREIMKAGRGKQD